jgi:hypothetical protein
MQKLTKDKDMPSTSSLYSHINPKINLDSNRSLISTFENNFVLRFTSLTEKGVILGTYQTMKKTFGILVKMLCKCALIWYLLG